jgi:hypothetical protein
MSYAAIRNALEIQLNTLSGAPVIVWENDDYTRTVGTPYIQAGFHPVITEPSALGSSALTYYSGNLLVNLYYPLNQGPQAADAIADQIVGSLFKWGTTLTGGIIILESGRVEPLISAEWYMIPVTVQWYCYL